MRRKAHSWSGKMSGLPASAEKSINLPISPQFLVFNRIISLVRPQTFFFPVTLILRDISRVHARGVLVPWLSVVTDHVFTPKGTVVLVIQLLNGFFVINQGTDDLISGYNILNASRS